MSSSEDHVERVAYLMTRGWCLDIHGCFWVNTELFGADAGFNIAAAVHIQRQVDDRNSKRLVP